MKFSLRPQNLIEWVAKRFNLAPIPVVHTQLYALLARAVYEAVALGVFEAIGRGSYTPEEIARRAGLNAGALASLLRVLEATGYVRQRRHGRVELTRLARKWLLADSPGSIRDHLIFMRNAWSWHDQLPRYLTHGESLDIHQTLQPSDWTQYRQAMASTARFGVDEVGRKTPLPSHPTRLLDIGGSHGLYADWFCNRYPTLHAEVLDLPEVLSQLDPSPRDRLRYVPADALTHDFGQNQYDLVLLCQVSHHFTAPQNQDLTRRVARALKPGGYFVVVELMREQKGAPAETMRSLVSLFFGLTSAAGLWSTAEWHSWQKEAGLLVQPPLSLLTLPGSQLLASRKVD